MNTTTTTKPIADKLLYIIKKSAWSLVDFMKILVLGFVVALLLLLPWLLRIAALLVWLVGGYFAIMAIQAAYSPFSQHIEVLALQFAVILAMTAIPLLLILK